MQESDSQRESGKKGYLLELLTNIQCLRIIVHTTHPFKGKTTINEPEKLQLALQDTSLELRDAIDSLRVDFHGLKIDKAKKTIQLLPDHLSIKLPLLASLPSQNSLDQHPFAAKEHYMAQLQTYQKAQIRDKQKENKESEKEKQENEHEDKEYAVKVERLPTPKEMSQLFCRECGCSLFCDSADSAFLAELQRLSLQEEKEREKEKESESGKGKEKQEKKKENDDEEERIKQVFSLPSPYWLEMADCWTCGGCCSFQQFPRGEIKALPFICFVADAFIMLHSSQLNSLLTHPEQKVLPGITSGGSELSWTPVACTKCRTPFGVKEIVRSSAEAHSSVRLFKYKITTQPKTVAPELNVFRAECLEKFCVSRLLSCSSAHTCYRFLVCNYEDHSAPFMQLVLTNWDSFISTNYSPLSERGMAAVVKVQYAVVEDNQQAMEWELKFRVEKLVLWGKECKELLELLEERNTLFPPSLSSLMKMKTSFLFC